MARPKYPSDDLAQFMVRMPPGLRDRIKAYAAYKGRSMNDEVVRILEREFPEPWTAGGRVSELLKMLRILQTGSSFDANIENLVAAITETVEGIYSGRVEGLDENARKEIEHMWDRYQEDLAHDAALDSDIDDVEMRSLELTGRTDKFVWPDGRVEPHYPPPESWDDPTSDDVFDDDPFPDKDEK